MDWRESFRDHVAPNLTVYELEALRWGLLHDDPALIQGATVWAANMFCGIGPFAPEAACAIGYSGWKANILTTTDEVRRFFHKISSPNLMCSSAHPFTCWFDTHNRSEVFALLLPEVNLAIAARTEQTKEMSTAEIEQLYVVHGGEG